MEVSLLKAANNGQSVSGALQPTASINILETAPGADWREMPKSEHFVQFYETEEFLLNSLGGFISAGLAAGDACIVVATTAHRERLDERLRAEGLDVATARASGQYVAL